jgi:hypothetical protein
MIVVGGQTTIEKDRQIDMPNRDHSHPSSKLTAKLTVSLKSQSAVQ